ncbi:MAG: DUF362 domain-containing protein [bacterium]
MAISRREFLKSGLGVLAAAPLAASPLFSWAARAETVNPYTPLLITATGTSPAENVRRALQALGGIEKFVKKGSKVLLKPNSMTRLGPNFAVNTHPDVVREVARLCRLAGASAVLALSHDDPSSWEGNGIGKALHDEGALYRSTNEASQYQAVNLPLGMILRETMVVKELLEYDVFINLPIAKHHAGSQLTLGLKNYMGLNWDRQIMHRTDLNQTIADLASVRRADLTIVDATRILLTNGPGGPGSTREIQMVIASEDPIAADAYTATLFKQEPQDIRHLRAAYELGLGEMNLKQMVIQAV